MWYDFVYVDSSVSVSGFDSISYLQNFEYISYGSTAHTHTMETHSMEKVPSMENFSINQTE